jgi:hypothetical protein
MNKRSKFLSISLSAITLSILGGAAAALIAGAPGDPQPPDTAPPVVPASAPLRELSPEVDAQIRATAEASSEGKRIQVTGTETAGSAIQIAGRTIQLPDDAWVKNRLIHILCMEGQECPPTPYFVLVRGNSTIEVDAKGRIWDEKIAATDDAPFDFLKESLR